MAAKAMTKATSGEATMPTAALVTLGHEMAARPPPAMPAPTRPPMTAWLDDEGMPRCQVTKFHMIAASSAAKTTAMPAYGTLTVLAMVLATAVPTKKLATKLNTAENIGAHRAGRARVATTVPTELAASWNPLVKSSDWVGLRPLRSQQRPFGPFRGERPAPMGPPSRRLVGEAGAQSRSAQVHLSRLQGCGR
jgi:hypothetical protein